MHLPLRRGGAPGVVLPDTVPGDGERSVTVMADLDESGRAVAVILRVDDLTGT